MHARRQYQSLSRTQRAIGAVFATVVTVVLFHGVVSLGTIKDDAIQLAQTAHVAEAEGRTFDR